MRTLIIISLLHIYFLSFSQQACDKRYCSASGASIKPIGKIRILSIFINIIYDKTPAYDNTSDKQTKLWEAGNPEAINSSPPTYLLNFLDTGISTGALPRGVMSRKYYESSFGKLVLLGDYMVLNILESEIKNPGPQQLCKTELVNTAIGKINRLGGVQTIYGHNRSKDYDLAEIDFSRSGIKKTAKPDGRIDLVQFLIRKPDPLCNDLKTGTGFTIHNPNASGYHKLKFDTLQPAAACYIVMGIGDEDITKNPNSVFIHEFAHLLLGDNGSHTSGGHTYNTNDCSWFMSLQGGYGLMGVEQAGLTSCNGYDRWRLGWTSEEYNPAAIPIAALNSKTKKLAVSDVTKETGSSSFILRDFVTSGDAIRIRLPYVDSGAVNQYIWLENHQVGKNNKLDQLVASCYSKNRSPGSAGIYAYMQIGKDLLHSNTLEEVYPKNQADNLRVISAEGFFDYSSVNSTFIKCGELNTIGYIHDRKHPNPFCGYSDQENKFFTKGDTLIWDKGESSHGLIKDSALLNLPYLGDEGDAFSQSAKINMGTNPSNTPMITFTNFRTKKNKWQKLTDNRTVYLSGLSISISNLKDGTVRVDIIWNDYTIKNDIRWTGNIVLNEKLELQAGKTIWLDQNYTPDQNTRDKNSGYFSTPTEMKAKPGSTIYLAENSKFVIDHKSTLIFEQGSNWIVENDAEIKVKNGSKLIINKNTIIETKKNVTIRVDGTSQVINNSNNKNLTIKAH